MEGNRTRTILVVDDAAMFRELGSLFLSRLGRVIPAADGEEGLFLARRHRPDVILLDLVMPGLDGVEVCERLRADPELQDTPVVILTASPRGEDHERAIVAGADQVIAKPISRVALIDAVNRYLYSPIARGMPRVPSPWAQATAPSCGLRPALVGNAEGKVFLLLVEPGRQAEFDAYLACEGLAVACWLDRESPPPLT